MRLRKISFSFFCFILLCIFFCVSFKVNGESEAISIKKDNYYVGKTIEIDFDYDVYPDATFKWVVNSSVVSTSDTYTPTASDYESFIYVYAYDGNNLIGSDSIYFSRLPVVYIDVIDKYIMSRDYYLNANMYIQGNKDYKNQYDGKIEIKERGSKSWQCDKKPYKIKLDKKTNIFDFGKSKHYVLLSNYFDISNLRNTVAYNLSSYMGLTSTDTEWVDVIYNNEYVGCYQLCEHVRIGKQLIDIYDWEDYASSVAKWINKKDDELEDILTQDLSWITKGFIEYENEIYDLRKFEDYNANITGGYLLELDSEKNKSVSYFETENGIRVSVSKPEYLYTNDEMFSYIKEYVQDVEDALTSYDGYDTKRRHYSELVDVDSMVAYWLCLELLSNEDASSRSRFCYLDQDSKLVFGPVWDADISSGSYRSFYEEEGLNVTGTVTGFFTGQDIFKEMVDDIYFQVKARALYWNIRPALEELIKEDGIIDYYVDYLYEAGIKNEMKWTSNEMTRSFSGDMGDVEIYKEFLTKRIAWFDEAFKTLEFTNSTLYTPLSSNPYKVSDKINISIENEINTISNIEYSLEKTENINLNIDYPKEYVCLIYVNGIMCNIDLGQQNLVVGKNYLNDNSVNVINVVCVLNNKFLQKYITVSIGNIKNSFSIDDAYKCFGIKTINNCEHEMVHLDEREMTTSCYGIKDCYYCNKCQNYYLDANGEESLKPSEVLFSISKSNRSGGIIINANELLLIMSIGAFIVISGAILCTIFVIKRRKRYGK